jgi:hypothetical protein
MQKDITIEYVPGVCNIGPQEIARRQNLGWVGLVIAVVLFAVLVWVGLSPWWRLFIFFPATLSASGFLQAYFHFCSGFARQGVFNLGRLGQTSKVVDTLSSVKDRRRGNQIMFYSVLIGAVIAVISLA